jgi:hypothetical protein
MGIDPKQVQQMAQQADARALERAMKQIQHEQMIAKRNDDAKLPEGNGLTEGISPATGPITVESIRKAKGILQHYKNAKASVDTTIVSNERWWQLRHWNEIRTDVPPSDAERRPEPISAWLQNAISYKHADFMDQFPEPLIHEREPDDRADAKKLSSILPVLHERNRFEKVYSDVTLYKLLHGTGAYGVFWDKNKDSIGDVTITKIDLLNLFFEPNITDIQDSRNVFLVETVDKDLLLEIYPDLEGSLSDARFDKVKYDSEYTMPSNEKVTIVDWYYKRQIRLEDGNVKTVLHFCKFAGDNILFASENDPAYQTRGWYDHGRYPIVLDPLFQMASTPLGYGFLHVGKDIQLYIDKLYAGILEAALINSRPRYFASRSVNLNVSEFMDVNKSVVLIDGDIDQRKLMQIPPIEIDPMTIKVLELKFSELDTVMNNEEFSRGATAGGVTAASAIATLVESGNKPSRNMINGSYRAFSEIVYLEIELIRQFYDEPRAFRIVGNGEINYEQLSNQNIREKPLENGLATRVPIFDIQVKAQRRSPISRASQNELGMTLYNSGVFAPQMAEQAMGALDMMEFEGKSKVLERVSRGMTLMNQMQQMQEMMMQMSAALQLQTGKPFMDNTVQMLNEMNLATAPPQTTGADPMAGQTKSYAQELIDRTKIMPEGGGPK